jgi:hypothetical protein
VELIQSIYCKPIEMIFIFDWGHTTRKEVGPISLEDLGQQGDGFLILVRYTSWFRLFFIPTIPTGYRYSLWNENAGTEKEVDQSFYKKYRPLAILNQKVADGVLNEDAYEKARAEIRL